MFLLREQAKYVPVLSFFSFCGVTCWSITAYPQIKKPGIAFAMPGCDSTVAAYQSIETLLWPNHNIAEDGCTESAVVV